MGGDRPLIPAAKKGGNKRTVDARAVVNGVIYPQHRLPMGGAAQAARCF
jgi:hypothetical protein